MPIHFRYYEDQDQQAFRALNEAWIVKLFTMEPKDYEVLDDPATYILKKGGHIFMGFDAETAVACCALIPREAGCFELSKMAVDEVRRGEGIGRQLIAYAIGQARAVGAQSLYLETNSKLANAIHLYESAGFSHVPPERVVPSPYARSNVRMELLLTS